MVYADTVLNLPTPGTMVSVSPNFEPALIRGLTVHKDNPFLFDFIIDPGDEKNVIPAKAGIQYQEQLKQEADRMIKYFFASLTIPDKDIWVNLSPYEKDRMIPASLSVTAMGRDLLAQDYMLKQLTASLIYPQKALGKEFWDRVYSKAKEMYGTTEIPVNTFNKVWIVPQRVGIYEHGQTAFIVDGHLKVMLEEDYLSLTKHNAINTVQSTTHSIGSQILRAIILPEIEKEVNDGKNFATLRQIFYASALAVWFKHNLKQALLNRVYANKRTVRGIDQNNPATNEAIYHQYLKAYKKGAFNFIQEDVDPVTQETMPRKYFSGGSSMANLFNTESSAQFTPADETEAEHDFDLAVLADPSGSGRGKIPLGQRQIPVPPKKVLTGLTVIVVVAALIAAPFAFKKMKEMKKDRIKSDYVETFLSRQPKHLLPVMHNVGDIPNMVYVGLGPDAFMRGDKIELYVGKVDGRNEVKSIRITPVITRGNWQSTPVVTQSLVRSVSYRTDLDGFRYGVVDFPVTPGFLDLQHKHIGSVIFETTALEGGTSFFVNFHPGPKDVPLLTGMVVPGWELDENHRRQIREAKVIEVGMPKTWSKITATPYFISGQGAVASKFLAEGGGMILPGDKMRITLAKSIRTRIKHIEVFPYDVQTRQIGQQIENTSFVNGVLKFTIPRSLFWQEGGITTHGLLFTTADGSFYTVAPVDIPGRGVGPAVLVIDETVFTHIPKNFNVLKLFKALGPRVKRKNSPNADEGKDGSMTAVERDERLAIGIRSISHGDKVFSLDGLHNVGAVVQYLAFVLNGNNAAKAKEDPLYKIYINRKEKVQELYNALYGMHRDPSLKFDKNYQESVYRSMLVTLQALKNVKQEVLEYFEQYPALNSLLIEKGKNLIEFAQAADESISLVSSRVEFIEGRRGEDLVALADIESKLKELFPYIKINLPEGMGSRVIRGNKWSLISAIYNIIRNAYDQGARRVECEFSLLPENKIQIIVRDDGPGIDEEKLHDIDPETGMPRMFNLGESGNGENRGLGLAEARIAVQDMGGEISVENVVEEGSVQGAKFVATLPLDTAMTARQVFERKSIAVRSISHGETIFDYMDVLGMTFKAKVDSVNTLLEKQGLSKLIDDEEMRDLNTLYQAYSEYRGSNKAEEDFDKVIHAMEITMNSMIRISEIAASYQVDKQLEHNLGDRKFKNFMEYLEYLKNARASVEVEMIQSRINIARGEAGHGTFTLERLFNSLKEIRQFRNDKFLINGISLSDVTFRGDFYSLFSAIYNIINNAHDQGASKVQCEFLLLPDHQIQIIVRDDGPGIDEEKLHDIDPETGMPRMFNLGESGNGENRGLGLAEARLAVQDMGGEISVENVVEQGSVQGAKFVATIPLDTAMTGNNQPKEGQGISRRNLLIGVGSLGVLGGLVALYENSQGNGSTKKETPPQVLNDKDKELADMKAMQEIDQRVGYFFEHSLLRVLGPKGEIGPTKQDELFELAEAADPVLKDKIKILLNAAINGGSTFEQLMASLKTPESDLRNYLVPKGYYLYMGTNEDHNLVFKPYSIPEVRQVTIDGEIAQVYILHSIGNIFLKKQNQADTSDGLHSYVYSDTIASRANQMTPYLNGKIAPVFQYQESERENTAIDKIRSKMSDIMRRTFSGMTEQQIYEHLLTKTCEHEARHQIDNRRNIKPTEARAFAQEIISGGIPHYSFIVWAQRYNQKLGNYGDLYDVAFREFASYMAHAAYTLYPNTFPEFKSFDKKKFMGAVDFETVFLLINGFEKLNSEQASKIAKDFLNDKALVTLKEDSALGGIDLTQQDAAMRVTKDANGGVKVDVDQAEIARVERYGLSEVDPVIIGMRPADIKALFGVGVSIQTRALN